MMTVLAQWCSVCVNQLYVYKPTGPPDLLIKIWRYKFDLYTSIYSALDMVWSASLTIAAKELHIHVCMHG